MNEFDNVLILKDEQYNNGLFPEIPNFNKKGSTFLLTEGVNDDIIVDDTVTTRQIRQGKYKRLIEVSMVPYTKEIRFNSASKETSYSFDVYVKAVIQIKDPLMFYINKNIDVDGYFKNLFSLDVRKITRQYSILDYDGMDMELTEKLSSYNNFDKSTGFEYRISVVDAEPGEEAKVYVRKDNDQHLGMGIKKKARALADDVAKTFESAIRAEVVAGTLSESEAIIKIRQYENANFQERLEQINAMKGNGLLTDSDVNLFTRSLLTNQISISTLDSINEIAEQPTENVQKDIVIEMMYHEED